MVALPPCAGCFYAVNVSGTSFERSLQVTVVQGLANRGGPLVWVAGLDRRPGMVGIEWFPGQGDTRWGPWTCPGCAGLRERWLGTLESDLGRRARWLSPEAFLEAAAPLARGLALYDARELHSLGTVLTACGVDDLLPSSGGEPLPTPAAGLPVRFDARGRWRTSTDAVAFLAKALLPRTNRSTLAVQASSNLPFLADAVVAWRLSAFWLDDLCAEPAQRAVLRAIVESHFDAPSVQYLGWFNRTRLPNPELLCQCTSRHRLLIVASDWSEGLSFLAAAPPPAAPLRQPPDAVVVESYNRSRTYVAVLMSDGDNIAEHVRPVQDTSMTRPDASTGDNLAEDYTTLRPVLERRLSLRSRVPVSWTVSNRWQHFGPSLLRWFYGAARSSGGHDSLLMGPSGYGYVFPGNISEASARAEWAKRTARAAAELGMEAYVHWDVDEALDARSPAKAAAAIRLLRGSAVRGVFLLNSVGDVGAEVGGLAVVGGSPVPWGFEDAAKAAATLGALPGGTLTYVYQTLGSDPRLVDELAEHAPAHVTFVGHRELIRLAHLRDRAETLGRLQL